MPGLRNLAGAVLLGCAAILVVGGCQATNTPTATSTSAAPPFPYPPFEIRADVAVPLEQPLADAAQFAARTTADDRLSTDAREEERYRIFRSKIAPEAESTMPRIRDSYVGSTGGALHRAVAAQQLPDGTVEVSVCLFNTPGLYSLKEDGELIPAPYSTPVGLWRPHVQWTDRPAADGSTSGKPRWLLTDNGAFQNMTPEQEAAVCDPSSPSRSCNSHPNRSDEICRRRQSVRRLTERRRAPT